MKYGIVGLSLLALSLACARPSADVAAPAPIVPFGYAAPEVYARWIADVQACVLAVAKLDSIRASEAGTARTFAIDHLLDNVSELRFFAMPTERSNAAFDCPGKGECWGLHHGGGLIYISAQRLLDSVTVKHEVMHEIVTSDGEANVPYHGVPWGLCEYN